MKIIKINGQFASMLERQDIKRSRVTIELPRATNEEEPSDERRGEE